jgi:hypothetical protein
MITFNFETLTNMPKKKMYEMFANSSRIHKWAPLVINLTSITSDSAPMCERRYEIPDMGSICECVTEWKRGEGNTAKVGTIASTPVGLTFTSRVLSKGNQTITKIVSHFELIWREEEKNTFLENAPQSRTSSPSGLKQYAERARRTEIGDLYHMTGENHN